MKPLAAIITLFYFLLSTGCGNRQNAPTDQPGLKFRLALELNNQTRLWDASHLFKTELEKADSALGIKEGEIEVEFYDSGKIGTERQLLEAAYFGVIEVVQINSSVVTTVEPAFSILDLPFLFYNDQHLKETLYGDIGHTMLDRLRNHGLQGLSFYSGGFRNMFYKRQDAECASTPEELEGLKLRVMESPVMINALNAIGPTATPIPFSELYQSIRTGMVDGAENSADIVASYRYYETGIDCFTLTGHFTNQHLLIANADWLDSIDLKYKQRIQKVAVDIVSEFDRIWTKTIQQSIGDLQNQGITVNEVDNKQVFFEQVSHIAAQFLEQNPQVPRGLYQQIIDEGNKYR